VALLVAAASVGAGSRLRRWLRVPVEPRLRLPIDWSLGGLLLGSAVLVLGLLGLWRWWALSAVVLAALLLGRWRRSRYAWRTLLPGALGALVTLPIALAPPFFYDALVYHLGLPWQGLVAHGLHARPEDLFSAFPPLAQLLYAPALALGCERAPALLHWASFLIASASVGVLARRLGAPAWAAFAAAACLPVLPCCVLVAGLPAAEGWLVSGVVLGATLLVRRRWVPGTGMLLGLVVGIAGAVRLQGVPWAAILLGFVLLRTWRVRPVLAGAAGWAGGAAPWWAKNMLLLHDPVAPVLWAREGIDTLWRDSGSAMHLGGGVDGLVRATLAALAPHASYLAPLALAALIAAVVRPRGRHRLVAGAVVAGVVAWGVTGNLPRFLTASAALTLALAASAAGRSAAGRWAAALSLAATAAAGLVFSGVQLQRWGGVALPLRDAAAVRARLVVDDPTPAFSAARALPAGARVLFVGEPRGFGFPRRFVAPSQHDVSPLRAMLVAAGGPGDVAAALRRSGFTHLLVNFGELARLAPSYPVAPWRDAGGWRRWNAFLSSLGSPVVRVGPVEVFAVPSGRPPAV
jgi:hypothetical protein